ncbi:DUF692 family protein [Dehalococcoidia bacterium]|nr:DUF692 family protein [Dehalococcoidia bacterium]
MRDDGMIRIGATLSPKNRREIADAELDFVEVKNLELEFLTSNADILNNVPFRSMHVQYLPSSGQKRSTFNLLSNKALDVVKTDDSALYEVYRLLKPIVISFHLGFSSEEVGTEGRDNHNFAIGRILSREEVFKRISRSLSVISDRFRSLGYTGEILVENLDYHSTGAYEYVCEPGFIREMVKETNCLVLLDVGHVIITSSRLKIHPLDFVRDIGVQHIGEVHVNSPLLEGGEWYDINQPFYRLEEAKSTVEYVVQGKSRHRGRLLLNVECDDELRGQLRYLKRLRSHGGATDGQDSWNCRGTSG